MPADRIRELVRDVPDFPKEGIVFKDISPILKDAEAHRATIQWMVEQARDLGANLIAGPESRGFIYASAVAADLGCGFIPIRKPGKLPWRTRAVTYDLEYGTDTIEIHEDAAAEGDRVLIVDDLLATGGTMGAACELVESLGATVAGCLFVIELDFLNGRDKLPDRTVRSLVRYS